MVSQVSYNENNVFAKIIKKEIPAKIIFQNDSALSFKDINPLAKIHVLVIPKGKYIDLQDFSLNSSTQEKQDFFACIAETIKSLNINEGYRTITNSGINANQEVPHFHMHILAGQPLGKMLCK
jgi:diadenosine tetraphosphate (Ap4A) HIT family hydrolase